MDTLDSKITVVDLFSGAGGMSYGFKAHGAFELVGAADAEIGKPTAGDGRLQCNSTYQANIGIKPTQVNLADLAAADLRERLSLGDRKINVLSVCPPCTGFSRANP
ncbi:TPA: DNA cytosine methyltransferase, partial [Escherichia coli]|nr:DNA cytosine methyltransferase [Escherichia coli]